MTGQNITKFMIKEHGKMLNLFLDFKKNKNQESFDNLEFIKKRHVFAEEKAIIMLQSSDREFPEMLAVLEQHEAITQLMDKIRYNFRIGFIDYTADLDKVINLMKKHMNFENRKFYPKLDKILNKREKEVMFKEFENIYKDFEKRQEKLEKQKRSLNWKTLLFNFIILFGIVLIFTAIDFIFHLLMPQYVLPDTYFRNKIIAATTYACIIYYFLRNKSHITKVLSISVIISILLQTRYYLEGYPLDFVFEFMGIHFAILFFISWIVLKLAKM